MLLKKVLLTVSSLIH